jgi:hypothetical protein
MLLGILILWWASLPGLASSPQTPPAPQAQSSQSTSSSPENQEGVKPPEHAPETKGQEPETKSQSVPDAPAKSAEPSGAKPAYHAPSATPSTNNENSTPACGTPQSKPSEIAPPAVKPETTEHGQTAITPKKKRSKKHKSTSSKSSGPRKVIVRDGGTAEAFAQLSPDMSSEEASHARETTTQLLSSAESNLQRASTRSLNHDQQAMVEQIRTFMEQSNAAAKAGDLQRGHNLAVKALLLSNELVKH